MISSSISLKALVSSFPPLLFESSWSSKIKVSTSHQTQDIFTSFVRSWITSSSIYIIRKYSQPHSLPHTQLNLKALNLPKSFTNKQNKNASFLTYKQKTTTNTLNRPQRKRLSVWFLLNNRTNYTQNHCSNSKTSGKQTSMAKRSASGEENNSGLPWRFS